MNNSYDLTTLEGLKSAIEDVQKSPIAKHIFSPYLWLAEKAIGLAEKAVDTVTPGAAVEKQAQAAADLIKAGKENGVKKMTITMEEQAGIHFDAPIEGVKISASAGSKGKTTISVEYT